MQLQTLNQKPKIYTTALSLMVSILMTMKLISQIFRCLGKIILIVLPIVYAGAFMPNSQIFINTLFHAFSSLVKINVVPENVHMYFLGTGMYPHKSITEYAVDHGISKYVTEIRERFPYLHILNFLSRADKVLIIGSTEKHYTASKTFQVILSKRPFLGMFHYESTAVKILHESNTDKFLVNFNPDESLEQFLSQTKIVLNEFLNNSFNWTPNFEGLEPFSARSSAKSLSTAIACCLKDFDNC